jgi:ankyrin repeat protein
MFTPINPQQPSDQDYTEIVRLLLNRGADINAQDEWGRTALMIAADGGYLETVKLLLDWEANVHLRDSNGNKALMRAAWKGHLEIVRSLLERGADVNTVDEKHGYTALLLAAGGRAQHDEFEAAHSPIQESDDSEDG